MYLIYPNEGNSQPLLALFHLLICLWRFIYKGEDDFPSDSREKRLKNHILKCHFTLGIYPNELKTYGYERLQQLYS